MKKIKIGVVAVASPFESGGQRGDDLVARAKKELENAGLDAVVYPDLVWDPAAALDACEKLKREDINSLVVIDVTWVLDSLKYLFTTKLNVPTVFWAVPYTETFSIGCIQHYGSIIKAMGYTYEYVYGLPEDAEVIEGIRSNAKVGAAVAAARGMVLGLIGPRQTWRVCGPQDMTKEEWDFSKKTGVTIVHVEMEEILDKAKEISDADGKKTLDVLLPRTGKSLASAKAMLHQAKVYMALKDVIARYRMDAVATECYPMYSGLMNLVSSWLAEEGVVVDTEGDIGHAYVMSSLNLIAGGGAVALGEAGSIDTARNIVPIAHEGSTAMSLADSLDRAQVNASGELGTFVGVPLKAMDTVTVAAMVGNGEKYKMFIAKGRTLNVSHDEWVQGGSKLVGNLQFDVDARSAIDQLIRGGMDHHFVIKEGDHTRELLELCDFMGYETLLLK